MMHGRWPVNASDLLLLLTIVSLDAVLLVRAQRQFTLTSYDCTQPKYVQPFSILDLQVCTESGVVKETQHYSFQVLRQKDVVPYYGYSCQVTETRQVYLCKDGQRQPYPGVANYEYGYVNKPTPFSRYDCHDLWISHKVYDQNGTESIIPTHTVVEGTYAQIGTINIHWSNATFNCTGVNITLDDTLVLNAVVIRSRTFLVQPEVFRIRSNQVEVLSSPPQFLPCAAHIGGCVTTNQTYRWVGYGNKCPLARVADVQGVVLRYDSQSVFLSLDNSSVRLLLQEHQISCGRKIIRTQVNDTLLYLIQGPYKPFYRAMNEELDGLKHLHADVKFTDLQLRQQPNRYSQEAENVLTNHCLLPFGPESQRIWRYQPPGIRGPQQLGPGLFSTVAGEILYRYECQNLTVQTRPDKRCYKEIPVLLKHQDWPIHSGLSLQRPLYMDPGTRVLTHRARRCPCSLHFLPKYHTQKQGWAMIASKVYLTRAPGGPNDRPQLDVRFRTTYNDAQLHAIRDYLEHDQQVMRLESLMAEQTGIFSTVSDLEPSQLFPQAFPALPHPRLALQQVLRVLHKWGEMFVLCIGFYAVLQILLWCLFTGYLVRLFGRDALRPRTFVGILCPQAFLLRNYRARERHRRRTAWDADLPSPSSITSSTDQESTPVENITYQRIRQVRKGLKAVSQFDKLLLREARPVFPREEMQMVERFHRKLAKHAILRPELPGKFQQKEEASPIEESAYGIYVDPEEVRKRKPRL